MHRVIAAASIVVTVAYVLRPTPREVVVTTAEHAVRLDSASQLATVHARLLNNTQEATTLLGCLSTPAFDLERHTGNRWIRVRSFPCRLDRAHPALTLAKSQTVTVPLRLHGKGEYRLNVVWIPHGYWPSQGRHATSLPFEVH